MSNRIVKNLELTVNNKKYLYGFNLLDIEYEITLLVLLNELINMMIISDKFRFIKFNITNLK